MPARSGVRRRSGMSQQAKKPTLKRQGVTSKRKHIKNKFKQLSTSKKANIRNLPNDALRPSQQIKDNTAPTIVTHNMLNNLKGEQSAIAPTTLRNEDKQFAFLFN